jgi:hypothetical protein
MTANAPNSQNGQLVVTYEVRENAGSCACTGFGADLTASTGVNDVDPINGASCSTFSQAEKDCLATKAL